MPILGYKLRLEINHHGYQRDFENSTESKMP